MTDLEHVAKRLIWWKPPAEALLDERRFLAQVMTYGTVEDLSTTLRHFPRSALLEVLDDAPPGVFDIRSWHYWHRVFGIDPVPELPKRRLSSSTVPAPPPPRRP